MIGRAVGGRNTVGAGWRIGGRSMSVKRMELWLPRGTPSDYARRVFFAGEYISCLRFVMD